MSVYWDIAGGVFPPELPLTPGIAPFCEDAEPHTHPIEQLLADGTLATCCQPPLQGFVGVGGGLVCVATLVLFAG